MKRILITGGAGFIGHHVVEHILKNTDWQIIIFDKLSYVSTYDRLRDIKAFDDKRVFCLAVDFTNPISDGIIKEVNGVDYILHMGAETHVDNSISNPVPFVMSNVVGTMYVLEFAKKIQSLKWFLYFSTDEVFGPAPVGTNYKEWDRYNSTNPYSAAKAGGEELCLAWANSYGIPMLISHTMNVYGERQHGEKFIPKVMNKVLNGEMVEIHSSKDKTVPGSRFWIHARNVASAILFLLENGTQREKYNIVGECEVNNLEMAQFIAEVVGKELKCELVDFHSSRPGHDLRYALDGTKMKELGWNIPVDFKTSLRKTIEWELENKWTQRF